MKVKIICESYSSSLQNSINSWLDSHSKKVKVIDIKYAVADRDSLHRHNAMIIYEE